MLYVYVFQIDKIERESREETSNCIFKMENNTVVDNVKNIQKVQINESKVSSNKFLFRRNTTIICLAGYPASFMVANSTRENFN